MIKEIRIAEDFSPYPSGRTDDDGPFNGTKFREDFLRPALNSGNEVIVVLDGVRSFGSSFFEEAFGGLIRLKYFTVVQLQNLLEVKATSPASKFYKKSIEYYLTHTDAAA